jgi:hypothetical protein
VKAGSGERALRAKGLGFSELKTISVLFLVQNYENYGKVRP